MVGYSKDFYYTYVLFRRVKKEFYIGCTNNITRRIKEHNSRRVRSTAGLNICLIYYEAHRNKYHALRRESYFKSTKGRTTLRTILRNSLEGIDR